MAEFAYNNIKNINTRYTIFKLNCGFNFRVLYEEDVELSSKLKIKTK